jgi:hypothetical protein
MQVMNKIPLLILMILLGGVLTTAASAQSEIVGPSCSGEIRTGTYDYLNSQTEIRYEIGFNKTSKILCIDSTNIGEGSAYLSTSIVVDGQPIPAIINRKLNSSDKITIRRNVTTWLNATTDHHWVSATTYGADHRFEFTEIINESNEGGFPTPYIEKINRVEKTNRSTSLINITVVNNGNRTYAPSLLVKTSETPSTATREIWSNNTVEVHTVRLKESKNRTIVGSVKLYYSEGQEVGKFDKKDFVLYPNGSAKISDKKFEQVPSLREVNSEDDYYKNTSALQYRDEGPETNPEARRKGRVAAGGLVAVLVMLGVLRYLR